jgi:pre-rRNA-processing protein TSR1
VRGASSASTFLGSAGAPAAAAGPPVPRTRRVLVAVGSVAGADPDRIVLKRTILSGFPVKVKRSSAVVQYMFFSPQDVDYFKPVELYTKGGLAGHITMSVGTHGRMKTRFDRPIAQNDTVCLPLYKRVYPKPGDCLAQLADSREKFAKDDEAAE